MSNKTVEIKRKIISLIRNRDPQKSLKLFLRVYNEDNPAELEFVKNIYIKETQSLYLYLWRCKICESFHSAFSVPSKAKIENLARFEHASPFVTASYR